MKKLTNLREIYLKSAYVYHASCRLEITHTLFNWLSLFDLAI